MKIPSSELIINADGSIYHLNACPGEVAETIITVGDQDRVSQISKYFDAIELKKSNREFTIHTGMLAGKRLTVLSTGIGTDNIDIVMNELDALFNIDFESRRARTKLTKLNIIRVGTSGALQADVPLDSFIASSMGVSLDGIAPYYDILQNELEQKISDGVKNSLFKGRSMEVKTIGASNKLLNTFGTLPKGITATCAGFYGPQGRSLRLQPAIQDLPAKLSELNIGGQRFTNFEMETAGIYLMARALGHEAISLNAILANRPLGTFSSNAAATVKKLIELTLEKVTTI